MILSYVVNKEPKKIYIKKNTNQFVLRELDRLSSDKKVLLIYDEKINKILINDILNNLKLSGCDIYSQKLTGSKINKTTKSLYKIIDFLLKNNFTKKSVILSFGGGVIGDICGLASCLYLRGMIYMHIPTTMTAIVDSCIGGKCGINYNDVINSIGAYYHPTSVFIDLRVLQKMPQREYIAGIPEILKYGLIKNRTIISNLKKNKYLILKRDNKILQKLIYQSLKTKIYFFTDDIYENNKRLSLNFGHTFAHAYEMSTQKMFGNEILRHGEAVGVGMLSEILYSNKMKKNKLFFLCLEILKMYNLPTELKNYNSSPKFIDLTFKNIFMDKKKISKYPRYIKLNQIGKSKIADIEDINLINDVLFEVLGY